MGMTVQQRPTTLRETGTPCAHCAAPLADDQRYCLNCGFRIGEGRVDFMDTIKTRIKREVAASGGDAGTPGATGSLYPWWRSPIAPIGAAVAVFLLILGVGILIGNSGDDSGKQAVAPPQVITVQGGGAPAAAAEVPFTADWPGGQDGFTIQLQALPKEGTQVTAVDAAKSDATTKGALEVGALDSDQFASLDPGNYVIYTGQYDTRKEAQKALKGIKETFPDASVVEVSATGGAGGSASDLTSGKKDEGTASKQQLQQLQKLSPDQYQKQSSKLPDKTNTEGKAPPKDDKKPGGGEGDAEVIK